jgi:hypothetical protein
MKIAMKMEIRPTEMPAARKKELPWGPSFDFLEPFFPFDGPHTVVTAVAELLLALL